MRSGWNKVTFNNFFKSLPHYIQPEFMKITGFSNTAYYKKYD